MIELEAKFRADTFDPGIIEATGRTLRKRLHQIDTYFITGAIVDDRRHYFRVRKDLLGQTGSVDYHIVISEFETEETEIKIGSLADADLMIKVFEKLGHRVECVVDKRRAVYDDGEFEISVDEVNELGQFVEIEAIVEGKSKDDILALAAKLGLDDRSRVKKTGYPNLLMEKLRG